MPESGSTWVLKIAETTIYAVRNRFWAILGVRWAHGGRRVGRRQLSGVPQVAVWGRLVAVRGRLGTRIGVYWPIWTPNKAFKGFTEVALGRPNASPRLARDISKAEKVEK